MSKLVIALAAIGIVGSSLASTAAAAPSRQTRETQNTAKVPDRNAPAFFGDLNPYGFGEEASPPQYHGPKSWY